MNADDTLSDVAAPAAPTLALPAELTIYTVGELHAPWCAWLAGVPAEGAPAVAADATDQADGAGVQLLLSLGQGLAQRGGRLQLLAPSEPLRGACAALGLAEWLDQHTADTVVA